MAMISLKNLVAPVSNSVHLASIVFVVLVFGVWRWSGGEVNFVRSTKSPSAQHSSTRDGSLPGREVSAKPEPQKPSPSRGSISVPAEAADDLLGSILSNGGDRTNSGRKAPAPSREKSNPSNSLEDIERSLGIK